MSWSSCPPCPVQANLFGRYAQIVLPNLPCTSYPVPVILYQMSCPDCPVMAVLPQCSPFRLSRPRCPVLVVMFWQSCSLFPVITVLSRLPYPAVHLGFPVYSNLSCQSILVSSSSVPNALYLLSCSDLPVLYLLSRTPCPSYPVHAVL
jgi:hypothetical protein